jgi:hypothetical protein
LRDAPRVLGFTIASKEKDSLRNKKPICRTAVSIQDPVRPPSASRKAGVLD